MLLQRLFSRSFGVHQTTALSAATVIRNASTSARYGATRVSVQLRGSHYAVLGVGIDATESDVKSAYRRKALECHPDVVPTDQRVAAETAFRRLSEAYSVLVDPKNRTKYDASLGISQHISPSQTSVDGRQTTRATPASQQRSESQPRSASPRRAGSPSRPGSPSRWRTTGSDIQFNKGLLRGQADAVFREAFQGKTIHEILFDARWAKKYGTDPNLTSGRRRRDGLAKSGTDIRSESPAEAMQTIRDDIARAYDSSFRYTDPKLVRVHFAPNAGEPQPPPDRHMPFRPFVGSAPPPGVTFDGPPVAEPPVPLKPTDELEVVTEELLKRRVEDHVPGQPVDGWMDAAGRQVVDHRRRMWPDNQGMLCSYQRPV